MSKTVIVTIETSVQQFAAGTVPAGIAITLSGGTIPAQTVSAPYSATFTDVLPGDYTATAQAVDHAGQPLGAAAVSAQFTVAADMVNVDVPMTVTISVA